jgi:hypothetical protein
MSIASSDIKFRYSVAAAAGNTTVGTAAGNLGDQISTTDITSASLDNLFDDVSSAEATAGDVEYRPFFVINDHATLTFSSSAISIQSQTGSAPVFTIGLDPTAISAKGSASAQAVTIADESTAPAGVTFGAGQLTIGDLAPGQVKAVWVKRTVTAGQAAITPTHVLRMTGDTLP